MTAVMRGLADDVALTGPPPPMNSPEPPDPPDPPAPKPRTRRKTKRVIEPTQIGVNDIISVQVTKRHPTSAEGSHDSSEQQFPREDEAKDIMLSVDVLNELAVNPPSTVNINLDSRFVCGQPKRSGFPCSANLQNFLTSRSSKAQFNLTERKSEKHSPPNSRQGDKAFRWSSEGEPSPTKVGPDLNLPNERPEEPVFRRTKPLHMSMSRSLGTIGTEVIQSRPCSRDQRLPHLSPEPCRFHYRPLGRFSRYGAELRQWLSIASNNSRVVACDGPSLAPTVYQINSRLSTSNGRDIQMDMARLNGPILPTKCRSATRKFVMTWLDAGAVSPRFAKTLSDGNKAVAGSASSSSSHEGRIKAGKSAPVTYKRKS